MENKSFAIRANVEGAYRVCRIIMYRKNCVFVCATFAIVFDRPTVKSCHILASLPVLFAFALCIWCIFSIWPEPFIPRLNHHHHHHHYYQYIIIINVGWSNKLPTSKMTPLLTATLEREKVAFGQASKSTKKGRKIKEILVVFNSWLWILVSVIVRTTIIGFDLWFTLPHPFFYCFCYIMYASGFISSLTSILETFLRFRFKLLRLLFIFIPNLLIAFR